MSYILDALRRAEAERSAMQAPDLGRLGTVAAAPTVNAATRHRPPRTWALLALTLVAFVVLATFVAVSRRERTPALPPPATSTQSPAVPRAERPPLPVAMTPPPPASSSMMKPPALDLPRNPLIEREQASRPATADTAASRPTIIAAPASAAASAPSAGASGAANRPSPNATTSSAVPSQPLPATPSTPPAPPAPLPAASQTVAIPSRDELPADVRRTLPPFGIGGTVYSPDPARRMLIVDGELWREGDQIRPELVIEQIRPRDAVLRFRGLRFSVAP